MSDTNELLSRKSENETSVVYGVYDSSSQPFGARLHDFFVERSRVGVQDKSYFFHLLAVMVDAGIPIMKALKVLSKKAHSEKFARVINTLSYDVERGKKLSESMAKFPDVFKESETGIVRSGEAIGNLGDLLFKLAYQTERTHNLMMKVRGALIYPITVLVALLISGAIVVTTVIPKLRDFFLNLNSDLPPLTNFVLNIGSFMVAFFWLITGLLIFAILIVSFYFNTESGKRRFDIMSLSIYKLDDVVRKVNVARFVQLLSILVTAGVPINESIRISAGAMSNMLYKDFLGDLRLKVERGEKIADNLATAPFLFPETVVSMISVGENTGTLGSISEKLAVHYEREVEQALDNFTTLLEPIVIVFVGLAVAVLALALLGPIFSLSTIVS